TFTNNTFGNVQITSLPFSGTNSGDFAAATPAGGNACALNTTIASGASCNIGVAFNPTAPGARSATLTVNDNTGNAANTISLSGTGVRVTLSATGLTYAPQIVSTTSGAQSVTVTNNTTSVLAFTAPTITGTNASDFVLSGNTCGVSLA